MKKTIPLKCFAKVLNLNLIKALNLTSNLLKMRETEELVNDTLKKKSANTVLGQYKEQLVGLKTSV